MVGSRHGAQLRRGPVRPDRGDRAGGSPLPPTRAPELGLTWPLPRDPSRIRAVLRTVDATPDGVLSADVDDERSISAMVARARVVANLVGPYAATASPCTEHALPRESTSST